MQDQTRLVVYRDSYRLALELERLMENAPRGFATKRNQLLDAAWSISTNIAEGCGASTNPEFARFLDVSMKSVKEVEHHLDVAADLKAISAADHARLQQDLTSIRRRLYRLIAKVRASGKSPERGRTRGRAS
jgi:four helix bundle protein